MSDIRFNTWLHQSGTGGVSQVDGGHVGIGTTNPDIAVHSANAKKLNVGIVTANSVYAGNFYGNGSNLTGVGHVDKIIEGDTKVEVFDAGSQYISAEVNGSEKLRIDSSGRVMIGTTTEGRATGDRFTIATNGHTGMTIRSGTSAGGNIFFSDGTSGDDELRGVVSYDHTNNFMRFYTNAAERLRIDSTGRISAGKHGVGTYNDASEWFKVQSNDTAANISIVGSNDTHSSLNLGDEDDFNIQKIRSDHTNNSLQFFTDNQERLRIASDGKIGIKTSTPIGTLDVYDGSFVLSKPNSSGGERNWRFLNNNVAAGNLGLQVSTAAGGSTFANLIEITKNGLIGIGEGTPDRRLHLKDPAQIKLESTDTGNWSGLQWMASSGTNNYDAYMGMNDSNGIFFIDNNSNGHDLTISREGMVSMPNQPMVRTRGGWSNVDWNGYKQMSWNGEDEDIGGNFSSGVFTVPSGGAGRYIMTAQFIGPSSSGQFVLWSFFKNTTALNPWVQIYSGSTNTETGAGTVAITCAVGDTLRIAWHGSYSSPYNGGYNSFSIYKVH